MTNRDLIKNTLILGVIFTSLQAPNTAAGELKNVFHMEVAPERGNCKYHPVIDETGQDLGWFTGIEVKGVGTHACYTRDHGAIGERYGFNNVLIGSGHSSDSGLKEYNPPQKISQ